MKSPAELFALNRKGFNLARGLEVVGVLLITLLMLALLDKEKYWESVTFGILFVGLSDPGGAYHVRFREMGWVAALGMFITGLGFALGGEAWGWVALCAFVVTLLSGLALKYGVHRFTSALMLNAWFLVTIAIPAGLHLDAGHSDWPGQALAWLAGAAVWITLTFLFWLARGRGSQPSHFPEIPGDMERTTLTRPVILFSLIKAVAVTVAVAIAFGFHLPNADWMPIATLVAMKGTLDQSTLVAEQRLIGALLGAAVAAIFLLTVDSRHVLQAVVVVLASVAATIRGVNYALYCAAIAAIVLITMDVSHPTNLQAEVNRVLFTLAGVALAWLVMLLVSRLQQSAAKPAA
jgi:uncharacterized membrane protein YccC